MSLVPDADLVAANAWYGSVRQAADVVGPLLGGVFVAVWSVRGALTVDVATFVVSVPLVLRLPRLAPEPADASSWLSDARAGVRYVFGNRVARGLSVGFFLIGLGAADDVALPFLARETGIGAGGDRRVVRGGGRRPARGVRRADRSFLARRGDNRVRHRMCRRRVGDRPHGVGARHCRRGRIADGARRRRRARSKRTCKLRSSGRCRPRCWAACSRTCSARWESRPRCRSCWEVRCSTRRRRAPSW